MTLNCSVSSSFPAITNVVMAYVNSNNVYLDLSTASTEDVKIVNDFIVVIGNHITINIQNYPIDDTFEVNIVISEQTDIDVVNIDYLTLNTNDTTIVNNFITLIRKLSNI